MMLRGPRCYKLIGREVVPCDDGPDHFIEGFMQRGEGFRKTGVDPHHVGHTDVGGGRSVSTVFLSLDHRHLGDGPPLVFETMIFDRGGNGEMVGRCSTWAEAEEMHEKAVVDARRLRVVK